MDKSKLQLLSEMLNINVEPFDPFKHKPIQTVGNNYATEYIIGLDAPKGGILNIPSIWFDVETKEPMFFDQEKAFNAAIIYELKTGKKFPRFDNATKANEAARQRSMLGGASRETLAQLLNN